MTLPQSVKLGFFPISLKIESELNFESSFNRFRFPGEVTSIGLEIFKFF